MGEGMTFVDTAELRHALDRKIVTLHSKIKCRFQTVDKAGKPKTIRVDSTPGRMLISELLPRHPQISFEVVNKVLT